MKHLIFALTLLVSLPAYAQKEDGFITAEKILGNAPDSVFNSTTSFAAYLDNQFDNDEEILRGIFVWIAKSVSYDIENMYQVHYTEQSGELAETTFLTRKAICQGYAELFNDLCHRCGIRSFVVNGYTKQYGEVSSLGHAWIVVETDSAWHCIDPTWGAGYILEGKFVRSFSREYFMADPSVFIFSHMPLDPMWQLLRHPLSIPDFYRGKRSSDEGGPFFAYNDSIEDYLRLNRIEQFEITLRRINERGIYNTVIRDYARYLEQTIENEEIRKRNEYQKLQVDWLNMAVDHYNKAVKQFNEYIKYFNQQFRPLIPDEKILEMLESPDKELNLARQFIERTDPFSMEMRHNIGQLENSIIILKQNVYDQEKFLKKYLSISTKSAREKLFRK